MSEIHASHAPVFVYKQVHCFNEYELGGSNEKERERERINDAAYSKCLYLNTKQTFNCMSVLSRMSTFIGVEV